MRLKRSLQRVRGQAQIGEGLLEVRVQVHRTVGPQRRMAIA
jgi:hypothetical protein